MEKETEKLNLVERERPTILTAFRMTKEEYGKMMNYVVSVSTDGHKVAVSDVILSALKQTGVI